ncbi:MAG: sugar ABC transporter permease, partial [Clostridiales bacterium]|nr:sugar ABC transporter permease [Clostridiales bacterium]
TAMLTGVIACAIYLFIQIRGRLIRAKKGYELEPLQNMLMKAIVVSAAILAISYQLSRHRGLPTVLIIVAIVVLVYAYITSKTTLGRYFYAVGGNEKATKLSGIDTKKVYFLAYTNMGFLAALAGMITIARLTSAQPTYGQNYEMDAIGSCFIGGASAYGGTGKVSGVIIGALLMGVINLGMSIMGVDTNWQKVVKGGVLLGAVIFDVISKKKAA